MKNEVMTYTLTFETRLAKGSKPDITLMRSIINTTCCNVADEPLICCGAGRIDYDMQEGRVKWRVRVHAVMENKARKQFICESFSNYPKTIDLSTLVDEESYDKLPLFKKIEYVLINSKIVADALKNKVEVNIDFKSKLPAHATYETLNAQFLDEHKFCQNIKMLLAGHKDIWKKSRKEVTGIEVPVLEGE